MRCDIGIAIGFIIAFFCPQLNNAQTVTSDSSKVKSGNNTKIKTYQEIITSNAITRKGLFIVHRVADRYFFEISDSVLDKDILVVNRIRRAANGQKRERYAYGGDEIGKNVIRFTKAVNNRVFIRQVSYAEISKDSSDNGLYQSILNSNLHPVVGSFDIKSFSPDSGAVVIDVTDYINGDNELLFFRSPSKIQFGIAGAQQTDKSFIQDILAFPKNIEVRTLKTYGKTGGSYISYELNNSFIMLPDQPMRPRFYDERVGYFSTEYTDFDLNAQSSKYVRMITRWRIEPREEDKEKYRRGELVEPQKPIVYYIDPATPKKWVKYLIQGVNDWQQTFEKAGFKNAIVAHEVPANDTQWNLADARHNVIVYKASTISNASGPNIHDPRSGEILETHINWYHNVMTLLHEWYFVQTAAIDPRARKMQYDDSLMGQLIRFVCAHEVGHTLGLLHNFGSSSTIPVDSLRSKAWVEANGHTPSIMDYARFNYVAQPEDNITEKGIFPRIGVYDKWAIEWGYRYLEQYSTTAEELNFLDNWIVKETKANPRLWFGSEAIAADPRRQAEDLGDDAIKASEYGIQNLKRILPHLVEWTFIPNDGYAVTKMMSDRIVEQYSRYLFHVANIIGGRMPTYKTRSQPGPVFTFPDRLKQKEALRFLLNNLFNTPEWIKANERQIFLLAGGIGFYRILLVQRKVLDKLLSNDTFQGLLLNEDLSASSTYTYSEMMKDLQGGIWKELKSRSVIDQYQRNLQRVYVEKILEQLRYDPTVSRTIKAELITDVLSVSKGQVNALIKQIETSLPFFKDEMSRLHLIDMLDRLKKPVYPISPTIGTENAATAIDISEIEVR